MIILFGIIPAPFQLHTESTEDRNQSGQRQPCEDMSEGSGRVVGCHDVNNAKYLPIITEGSDLMEEKVKLSLAETGKLLGYSYPTMLEWANRKDTPAFKCMGKWIVPYDALIRWMEKQAGGDCD